MAFLFHTWKKRKPKILPVEEYSKDIEELQNVQYKWLELPHPCWFLNKDSLKEAQTKPKKPVVSGRFFRF